MKKSLSLVLIGLLIISSVLGVASAKTYIAGRTYNGYTNVTDFIPNANVNVTCVHNGNETVNTMISDDGGFYSTEFNEKGSRICVAGDTLKIDAAKEGLSGHIEGVITKDVKGEFVLHDIATNVGLVWADVPLVPEFGIFAGVLTIVSAMAVFFVIRKR